MKHVSRKKGRAPLRMKRETTDRNCFAKGKTIQKELRR
jgi:hypothetical protein